MPQSSPITPVAKPASPARFRACPSCGGQMYLGHHGRTYLCINSISCARTVRVNGSRPRYSFLSTH